MIWLKAGWAIFRGSLYLQIATAALLGWLTLKANNVYQRYVGANQHAEKVETANKAATQIGGRAASKSADSRVRGVRDPTTRND